MVQIEFGKEPIYSLARRSHLWKRLALLIALIAAGFLLDVEAVQAHERWILTPDQIVEWDAKPTPVLYSELSWLNVSMISAFLVFTAGWIWLGFTGARELFPDLQARLGSYGHLVAPVLRFCLAWALISSAFGLEPRFGVPRFMSPTSLAIFMRLTATVLICPDNSTAASWLLRLSKKDTLGSNGRPVLSARLSLIIEANSG